MLNQLRQEVEQERGKFNRLIQERRELNAELKNLKLQQEDIEQAKEILRLIAQQTQQQLEFFISDIVSLALETVFDNPYKFKTEFVLRRGKTECDLWFEKNGYLIRPTDATGGGPIDVASFGLRLSLWSLNKNRPVLVLDEPFKHLSGDLHQKSLAMLKQLAYKLNIQIIMISHSRELTEGADKVFKVHQHNGVSSIA